MVAPHPHARAGAAAPTTRPDQFCVVCGEPIAPRARATTRCRVCDTMKAQANFLAWLKAPRQTPRRKIVGVPSIPHTPH
jgi:hypothetical protein